MNIIIIIFIIAIIVSLSSAFLAMLRGGGKESSDKMLVYLEIRIGLSLVLFIILLFSSYMGWVTPNNLIN